MYKEGYLLLLFGFLFVGLVFSTAALPEGSPEPAAPIVVENAVVAGGNAQLLTMQYGAVLGQPVTFKKTVTVDGIGQISVGTDLPQDATNISVVKITATSSETITESAVVVMEVNEANTTTSLPDYNEGFVNETTLQDQGIVSLVSSFFSSIFLMFTTAEGNELEIDGYVEYVPEEEVIVEISDEVQGETTYEVTYQLPPPEMTEEMLDENTKQVVVSADYNYTNILVYTGVEERLPEEVAIFWVQPVEMEIPPEEGSTDEPVIIIEEQWVPVEDAVYLDTNNNGLVDTVLWVVPHLSSQTYVIVIPGGAPAEAPAGLSVSIAKPGANLFVAPGEVFNVSVEVACTGMDCGNVNVTLDPPSDIKVALICYNTGCTDASTIISYLTSQGFQVTAKPYSSWTEPQLDPANYDVMVCTGYTGISCSSAFRYASNPGRDAFENEALPLVSIASDSYAAYFMGISTSTGSPAYSTYIKEINTTHPIMTGFSGNVVVYSSSYYITSVPTGNMLDPYSKLFGHGAYTSRISGYALEKGKATTGTNPGKFVHLGFNPQTYATTQQKTIVKQAICWAATGTYDCTGTEKGVLRVGSGTPFYVTSGGQNPVTCSGMQDGDLCQVEWEVASNASIGVNGTFFAIAKSSNGATAESNRFVVKISPLAINLTRPTEDTVSAIKDIPFNVNATLTCYNPGGCGAVTVTLDPTTNYVWQPVESGQLGGPYAWSYIMGYQFTPQKDMQVSELCAYITGNKTVKLWGASKNELASASVNASGEWACARITPVPVQAGQQYYVGVCLGGTTGGYRRTSINTLPTSSNDVQILNNFWASTTSCTLSGISGTAITTMQGMADIGVQGLKGAVPMNSGTPFYTTSTNPVACPSLGYGNTCQVSWSVIPTGEENTKHLFFVIAENQSMKVESRRFDVAIMPGCADVDEDGYSPDGGLCGELDCDDANANVYPGATELCDDPFDNNCDGQINEDCCGDTDEDGYGTAGGACGPIDCNDANPNVYPGATEVCDGADNNCDSAMDENDALPPVTTDDAPANWMSTVPVTVSLSAVDYPAGPGQCGVGATRFCVDQTNNCTPYEVGETIPVFTEGINYVRYYSADNYVYNQEPIKSATVKIDRTSPETTDDAPENWQNSPVVVSLSASDALSGVYKTYYSVEDQYGNCTPLNEGTSVPVSAEGINYLRYYSVDNAGNVEAGHIAVVRIDLTAPRVEITPLPAFDGDGDLMVSWSGVEEVSKIAYFELYRNEVLIKTTTETSAHETGLLDATSYVYTVMVYDLAGNAGGQRLNPVVIDLQPPTVPAMHPLPQYSKTNFGPGWPVVFTSWDHSTDPFYDAGLGSGLNHYSLFRNGERIVNRTPYQHGPTDDGTTFDDAYVLEGMTYNYSASATDNVDHESALSDPVTTTVDTVAPYGSPYFINGVVGDNGWFKSTDITLGIDAHDETSGVKSIHYTLYNILTQELSTGTYTGPLLIPEGVYYMLYDLTDYAGNTRSNPFNLKLDTSKPVTTDDYSGGWKTTKPVVIHLSATDVLAGQEDMSGVAATYYCNDWENICRPESEYNPLYGVEIYDEGINYLRYYSRDTAGNKEAEKYVEIRIDTIAPSIPEVNPLPQWDADGTVELDWAPSMDCYAPCRDCETYYYEGPCNSSGVAFYKVLRKDVPDPSTGREAVDFRPVSPKIYSSTEYVDTALPSNATYYYYVVPCDYAGNCNMPEYFTLGVNTTVDTDNPSVQITYPASGQIFQATEITIEADYANTYLVNCNVSRTGDPDEYGMNGDNQVSGTANHEFTGLAGPYDFTVKCWDETGNMQSNGIYGVLFDTIPPVTTDNAPAGCNTAKPITVSLFANDPLPGSGVVATYYCTDTTNTCTPSTKGTSIVVDAEGTTYIRYNSTDAAGNSEAVKSASVYVDTVPPEEKLEVTASNSGTCIGQFLYNCTERKSGSVELNSGEEIYAGGCLSLENLATDATSGVESSRIEIMSSSGRLLQSVPSPGPSNVNFASLEGQLLASESCWVDVVVTSYDGCGNSRAITTKVMLDEDKDGVCNAFDLCGDTAGLCNLTSCKTKIPTSGALNPNHYEDTNCDGIFEVGLAKGGFMASPVTVPDAYGCTCEQILATCKPGKTDGEYKFGCSTGTLNSVWIPKKGWAVNCIAGIKPTGLDTDRDGILDEQDPDIDGDGVLNELDAELDSTPVVEGRDGTGLPDWWCAEHPENC